MKDKKNDCQMLKRKQIESKINDKQRWSWLARNSSMCNFVVMLDSDVTYISDHSDCENYWECVEFDNHIGNSKGVRELLDFLNIKFELV